VTGECRELHNEELNDLYCTSNIMRVIKLGMGLERHVACTGGKETFVLGFGGET
jgi:hypothetical protein